MNKKILIGSIIAVAVLVLVSFTGVVGYQTTQSSTIARPSPLFTVRSSRAIEEDSKDFTCDYVGKGEEIIIPLSDRNNNLVLLEKIKDSISKMDEEEINHIKKLIIGKLNNINDFKETNINNGIGGKLVTGYPIPGICDFTTKFPILCFLENLYDTILYIVTFFVGIIVIPMFLLFLLAYILVNGDLPPTLQLYPMTFDCCHS
ncbi:hypothetical protein MBGDF03_00695 [Thermoplasmatales archaeon SCGC AB-540-F20]|nr:hypothetical protein MBGDF03_00695 [Thermoplasmatales archaeon SCGC AB-540-F20]